MSFQEENGYQLQNDQVNLKEMKKGVGLNFYIELNPAEQVNCERMEIDVEGSKYLTVFDYISWEYLNGNPSIDCFQWIHF